MSQFVRAAGQTDWVGISLLLFGGIGLAEGVSDIFAAPNSVPTPTPVAAKTAEERIRQLDDLRAKHLITDAEYEQRKQAIIASL